MFPTRQSVQHKLLEGLNTQRLAGKFCDVMLNIGNTCFPIHSCVFALFSPEIFEKEEINEFIGSRSFKHPWTFYVSLPNTGNNVTPTSKFENEFVDCSACASRVIEFMYKGKIQIPKDHLHHVEALSAYLQISELGLICEKFVGKPDDEVVNSISVTDSAPDDGSTNSNQNTTADPANYNGEPLTITSTTLKGFCFPDQARNEPKLLDNETPTGVDTSMLVQSQIETTITYPRACTKCELTFSNSAQLQEHRETHIGKLYTCYSCKYSSRRTSELLKHLVQANHNESVCSLCMHESETPFLLRQHIEKHNHPKPFFCAICNQRFSSRTGLNFHTPKHSTKTPFCCSVCQRGFKWKHNLQSHLVVHTTEKKLLCDQCGFSTAHKSTLNAHELGHTGHTFKCPEANCKFEAVSKRNMTVHFATHKKEKPYQCEVCGQSFSQAKNLRRHALKHDAAVDFYNCSLCTFKTMRHDKFKEHCEKHHSIRDKKPKLPRKKKSVTSIASEKDVGPLPVVVPNSDTLPVDIQQTSLLEPTNFFFMLPITTLTNYPNCISLETQVLNVTTAEILQPASEPETRVLNVTTAEILQPASELETQVLNVTTAEILQPASEPETQLLSVTTTEI